MRRLAKLLCGVVDLDGALSSLRCERSAAPHAAQSTRNAGELNQRRPTPAARRQQGAAGIGGATLDLESLTTSDDDSVWRQRDFAAAIAREVQRGLDERFETLRKELAASIAVVSDDVRNLESEVQQLVGSGDQRSRE